MVLEALPTLKDAPTGFDAQSLFDARGRVSGTETLMLAAATPYGLDAVAELVRSFGGLLVAAHADRPSFSVTSQLGLFPEDVEFDAVELSRASCGTAGQDFAGQGIAGRGVTGAGLPDRGVTPAAVAVRGRTSVLRAGLPDLPQICSSDSHFLSDIGTARTVLEVSEPSFEELSLAIRGWRGRRCWIA
jgi:hypothetical protein